MIGLDHVEGRETFVLEAARARKREKEVERRILRL
jgi:hypothetical protein